MRIRNATLNDLKAVADMERACFPAAEAASEESFRGRLKVYPECFWLMEDENGLVSFINGFCTDTADLNDDMYADPTLHDPNGAWQMIFGVNTDPGRRREGNAGRLMRQVIADTKARGKKGLVLTCKDALVHWYASFGFVSEGISASEHGGVTWYQMRLTF